MEIGIFQPVLFCSKKLARHMPKYHIPTMGGGEEENGKPVRLAADTKNLAGYCMQGET